MPHRNPGYTGLVRRLNWLTQDLENAAINKEHPFNNFSEKQTIMIAARISLFLITIKKYHARLKEKVKELELQ